MVCNRQHAYGFTTLPSINTTVLGCISLNLGRKRIVLRYWVARGSLIKEQFIDV